MNKCSILLITFLLFFLWQCTDVDESASKTSILSGEELAKIHCASCHLYPEPALLDKATWGNFVLIRMAAFLGIYHNNVQYLDKIPKEWLEPGIGGKRIKAAKIYPESPLISVSDWEKIRDFYLEKAPLKLPTAAQKKQEASVPYFEVSRFNQQKEIPPLIQAIHIDENQQSVYASAYQDGIYRYDFSGKLLEKTSNQSFFVDIRSTNQQFVALDMATRYATDNPQGQLYVANTFQDFKTQKYTRTIPKLMRPVSFNQADLNNDGILDFIIAEYGNYLGALNWYDGKTMKRHQLYGEDGAIKTAFADFNKDGLQDIIALQANGNEGIDQYLNQGDGTFKRQRILRFLPTNGSTDFQLLDYNGDGEMDILYANGDNGDYTPLLKPYHGVHLYLAKAGKYEEAFFLPLHGVYQAEAVDFDRDGDMDIAAVAFHPDFQQGAKESFVIFDNDGKDNFTTYTIPQAANARWMRFSIGDIDGDQDQDILLSAMNIKTPEIPPLVAEKWEQKDEAILILRNTTQ